MIVYLIFFLDIFLKIKRNTVSNRVVITLIGIFLLNIIFAMLVFLDSDSIDMGTQGSDSLVYYMQALEIKNNPNLIMDYWNKFSGAYICLISLTLITFPSDSSFVIIFLNVIIMIDLMLTLYLYLEKKKINEAYSIMFILGISGAFTIVGIQILKDIFLLFLFVNMLYTNFSKIHISSTFILLIIASNIRPYIWIPIVPLLYLDYKINKEIVIDNFVKPVLNKFFVIFIFSSMGIFYYMFQELIETSIKIANETGLKDMSTNSSFISGNYLLELPLYLKLPISLVKFIFLPLPFAVWSGTYSSFLLQLLYFLQALILHTFFLASLFSLSNLNQLKRKTYPLLFFALIFTLTYSLIYLGNADIRLRLPIIIIMTILGSYSLRTILISRTKTNFFILLLILYLTIPSLYKYTEYISLIVYILASSIFVFVIYFLIKRRLIVIKHTSKL